TWRAAKFLQRNLSLRSIHKGAFCSILAERKYEKVSGYLHIMRWPVSERRACATASHDHRSARRSSEHVHLAQPCGRRSDCARCHRAHHHEHDREEWRQRGVLGVVTALNPATREITVNVRGREGAHPVVVAATETTKFRRYAPDSVKFSDAKPSSLTELKVGDQLRALGERSADGARFTPEEFVSGSFRTLLGTVTAVDAAHNQITIKDNQTKQPLTVLISQDSSLRRLPEQMAQMMAMRGQGGAGGPGMFGGGRPGGPGGQPPANGQPPTGGPPQQAGEQGGMGARRMGGGGGFDMQAML